MSARVIQQGETVQYFDRSTYTVGRWVEGTARYVTTAFAGLVLVVDAAGGSVCPWPDDIRRVEAAA